jgi:CHAD domain-containing protein
MKARRVGVDPDGSFAAGVGKLLAVRMDELDSFAEAAQDPAEVGALHDMRIAAKRVRYVLELAEPVEAGAKGRIRAAKRLQDLLGDIHDCDELMPLVKRHVKRLRQQDATAAAAGEPLPNRRKYRGLEALRAHTLARRAALHDEFVKTWPRLRRGLEARETTVAA